ncbi:MAG: Flp family type IVb pilin [Methylocella sp.]
MKRLFTRFAGDESGVTVIEYGMIASFIFLVIITAVKSVGANLPAIFNAVASNLA